MIRRCLSIVSTGILALVLLLGGALAPAAAEDRPVVETALTIAGTPESDQRPVRIDLTLLTTDPQRPSPAIVLAHGFGGSKNDSIGLGRRLAQQGYAVIAYTARGFGASGGLIHLDSPDYEGKDAVRIVDWAATRPEIIHTGDDPVIGFAGGSYGGAVSLLAASLDRRVDAIAPAFTWNSLSQSLFPQYATSRAGRTPADVASTSGAGVFKQRWASLFFLSGLGGTGSSTGSSTGSGDGTGDGAGSGAGSGGDTTAGADPTCGRFAADVCRGYQQAAASGRPSSSLIDLLDASGPAGRLSTITAPMLIVQGEDDTLFPLDQADATLRGLPAATPSKMIWAVGGHDAGIDLDGLLPDLEAWFGRYLKHDGSQPDQSFRYAVPQNSLVGRNEDGGRPPERYTVPGYPGLGRPEPGTPLALSRVGLDGGRQQLIAPPGGSPAALTNLPGTGGALAAAAGVAGYQLGVLPGQSATFTGPEQRTVQTVAGGGSVDLDVASSGTEATLFVGLWDLGPDRDGRPSTAVLPGLAVSPVHLTGLRAGQPTRVSVALPAIVHRIPVGHRWQLVVSSTDQAYAMPRSAASYAVALADSQIVLPIGQGQTSGTGLDVSLPLVITVAALVLAAIAALIVMWLRRRAVHPRADLAEVPLHVEGLVKTYAKGVRAVDGVSLGARRGQVVGLLGPNGAGKTTVLRMLVGLIRPDSGSIWVDGQAVHAGADVLGSVGAFIEGPGFLPHLTGRQNLDGYWAATGRPPEEAHLAEALQIADLGSAIDRPVRGYSQGMRQRLGIAQAMLGLPDLLLLDEPTNGLDPPQIKAMRGVLADYAAAGRTVVVSSHLLAEVQQTCSDVVVMARGRVVLSGSVAELTATDHVTMIGVSEGAEERAVELLRAEGLQAEQDADQIRVSGERPRAEVVELLVTGGVGVESVDGRRQLEEVFMNLMAQGDGGAQSDPRSDDDHGAVSSSKGDDDHGSLSSSKGHDHD